MNEYVVCLEKFSRRHRHVPLEEILTTDWQFVFFFFFFFLFLPRTPRNQSLFSSHSRNMKYEGTHDTPEFYFYTHSFEKSLRFHPNLVREKRRLWDCNQKCQVSIQSSFCFFFKQLSCQAFKGLVKTETIRNQKKKKVEILTASLLTPLGAEMKRKSNMVQLDNRASVASLSAPSFLPSLQEVYSVRRYKFP